MTDKAEMNIRPLLLAGGNSTRMGSRKELLRHPGSNKRLYAHLLRILHETCPESEKVYMSLRNRDAVDTLCGDSDTTRVADNTLVLRAGEQGLNVRLLYDADYLCGDRDIGPAAGMVAAYYEDPAARWLVVACDFPLLTHAALRQLRDESVGPLTCFVNGGGFPEPLLAVWTPDALRRLETNIDGGNLGPMAVVRELKGKCIRPVKEKWLFNANTKEEWDVAMDMMGHDLY
jgi:molybdopterin-guanine dinucleotide biosynthesis protein A